MAVRDEGGRTSEPERRDDAANGQAEQPAAPRALARAGETQAPRGGARRGVAGACFVHGRSTPAEAVDELRHSGAHGGNPSRTGDDAGAREVDAAAPAAGCARALPPVLIRALTDEDWPSARRIYEQGIATRNATFAERAPSWAARDAGHVAGHRLVAERDGRVVGWAALAPVSPRPCSAGVAEASVYVAGEARGQGVGSTLLAALVDGAERAGLWTIQASIFPENEASLARHRRLGSRVVGVRERIGRLDGTWRDTVLLQRRSGVAGTG